MADVDMTDAPAASGSAPIVKKPATKAAKGAPTEDGKKKFEVKKVAYPIMNRRFTKC